MLKRTLTAVTAAGFLATATAVATPASAAGYCSVALPTKVSVTSPYKAIRASFSSGCTVNNVFASWSLVHPTQGPIDGVLFDAQDRNVSYETVEFYDWEPRGRYDVRPDGAFSQDDYADVTQNERTLTVKLGSRQSAAGARSGSYVTVSGTAARYSPNAGAFRAWSGATVRLYQKKSGGSWTYVKTTTSNSTGRVSVKAYASTARYFQLRSADSSTTWGTTSASVYR
ncbi:hypothetical protein [Janibacter sp. G1551]|uniref:hypothetical protein n=1 Tax=Janibacter sp. G1551 TaxID=3420440 RepID=UPI003D044F6C